MTTTNLLAISGSLRARSINTEVLRAVAHVAPPGVTITLFSGLAELPPFNPDLDGEGAVLPEAVLALRSQVAAADGVLVCSPEYAHGVPGVLKNALDWLVSGPEIVYKPIGLLNASPRSTHAQASLAETLRTMSTVLVAGASVGLPVAGRQVDARDIAADPVLGPLLRGALDAMVSAAAAGPSAQPVHPRGTMPANRSMPPGTIIPELAYTDVIAAAQWLCNAFGFVERLRIGTHRVQLRLDEASIVVVESGASGRPSGCGGVMVRVADADAHHATAVAAGAQTVNPPADHPFGERQYSVIDVGGHRWTFSQSIADVDPASWGGQLVGR